eukprot:scaffold329894_cov98-Tisochrysis_lutea.AAC.1
MQILQQRLQIAAAAADAEAPAAGLDVEEQPQPQGQQQLGGPRASATMQGHQPLPIQKKRGRPPKQPQQQQPALGTHQAAPTRPPLPRKRKQQAAGTSKRSIRRAGAAVAEVVTAYAPEVQPAVLQAAVNRRDMAGARKVIVRSWCRFRSVTPSMMRVLEHHHTQSKQLQQHFSTRNQSQEGSEQKWLQGTTMPWRSWLPASNSCRNTEDKLIPWQGCCKSPRSTCVRLSKQRDLVLQGEVAFFGSPRRPPRQASHCLSLQQVRAARKSWALSSKPSPRRSDNRRYPVTLRNGVRLTVQRTVRYCQCSFH